VIGTWAAFLLFGGEFPANDILSRLFIIHVLLIPGLIVGLLTAHMAILWRQKHTQFPGPGRTETNVVGSRFWPSYAAKSIGLLLGIVAVLTALGGLAQINPIWLYGPFSPSAVSSPAQPDWYLGWMEGALRLFPPVEIRLLGFTIPNPFFPAILFPGLTFTMLFLWPFIEQFATGDGRNHELLDRPRDRPMRTALGVGTLTFYAVLLLAGANDVIARKLGFAVGDVTVTLRVLLLALPLAAMLITRSVARSLARSS
jgi:ubiquinol-cytochrome c reductase cytochrome b subunit